jgi:hypothetical protein
MANITITVSTAQAATIDRTEYANTTAFVQAKMDGIFAGRIRSKQDIEFAALTDAQKATAITAGKAG